MGDYLRRDIVSGRSIQSRVAFAVGATSVSLLIIVWAVQSLLSVQATLREIDEAQTGFAKSFSQRAEERVHQLERTLGDSVATLDLGADVNGAQIELRRLLRLEPKLVTVTYESSDRAIRTSVLRDHIALTDVDTENLYGIRFGQISLGEVDFRDPLGARVPFKYVRASKWPGGSLNGRLSLALLSDLIAEFVLESGSSVFVSFTNGRVVAHQNTSLAARTLPATETVADDALWTHLVKPFLGSSWIGRDRTGQLQLVASSPIAGSPLHVYFTRPLFRAIARVIELQVAAVATLLAVLIAALFASQYVARALTRPIIELREVVSGAGASLAFTKPKSVRNDEVGELFESFSDLLIRLADTNKHLEQRVIEKTKDLENANILLSSASRHKSEFLAHMSHELRTPLNAVIGFSDLLKAQYFGPLNQKQSEYVRDINASGQHLLSLINDILDLAKVEAGRMELVLSDSHVPTLVESCVALVSERVSRSRQTLTTDVAPDVTTWPLDERKVKQCLLNLLTNASKFTPVGGVITLRVWVASNELVAAVSDNGVGIAAEDLPKLFSEFYQAKAAGDASGIAAQREGTGLGLALTKGFVELHGGTISVESVVGKGSTFTMRFPGLADGGVDKAALTKAENLGAAK